MTNVFYDTEFIDDGKTIDLISIGMVAEDGREYYAISKEFNLKKFVHNQWLMENVFPTLPKDEWLNFDFGHPDFKSRAQIRDEVWAFLRATPKPKLWAWYGAYDHVALAQLFGSMIDLPEGVPMYTNDLCTLYWMSGYPRYPAQTSGEHNALADARHNKIRYEWMVKSD